MATNAVVLEPPCEVDQEAALNLRCQRITAIMPIKLEQGMTLLQLGPDHLVDDGGLACRSLPTRDPDQAGEERDHQQNEQCLPLTGVTSDVEGRCPPQVIFTDVPGLPVLLLSKSLRQIAC